MIMGIITTCIISFILIAINIGFTEKFFKIWFKSWLLSYTVAIPAILIIAPQIEKLVGYLFKDETTNNI